jgi:predicted dienelactone hydrolase
VAAALALIVSILGAAEPALADQAPVRLVLPAPTGPDRLGTVALHLVDSARQDPWVASRPRELMVSIWYPARDTGRYPVAPWMTPGAFAQFEGNNGIPSDTVVVPATAGHDRAPVLPRSHGWPVLLFSPGLGGDRTMDTTLVEDLASRGYIVVTIDHTYDAEEVEFPDGRVLGQALPDSSVQTKTTEVAVRVTDTRFVLDQLVAIDRGANPDAEHTRLPKGLPGALDLSRVGMIGHSMGGATAAAAQGEDARIRAGLDLDGTLYGPVIDTGLNSSFMLVSSQPHNRDTDPSWATFWSHLTGWRLDIKVADAQHVSFTDAEILLPQLAATLHLTPTQLAQQIGTIDPAQARMITQAYVAAFFDLHLQHHDDRLLCGPSARYPEVQFIP